MLGKLLGKDKAAKKMGTVGAKSPNSGDVEVGVYLSFPGSSDDLSTQLVSKLTVGSDVGDIIVPDDSVSPRHCTFILNKGNVVMIMDHSSQDGTFINKKRLAPSKMFFISEKDKVKIGSLEAKIELFEIPVDAEDLEEFEETAEIPLDEVVESSDLSEVEEDDDIGDELEIEAKDLEEEIEEEEIEEEELEEEKIEDPEEVVLDSSVLAYLKGGEETGTVEGKTLDINSADIQAFNADVKADKKAQKSVKANNKKSKKTKVKIAIDPSANGLYRLLAVIIDLIISFTIWEVFKPFTDFVTFFNEMPGKIINEVKPFFTEYVLPYYQIAIKEVPEIDKIYVDVLKFEYLGAVGTFLLLYLSVRISTSLIFGTSIGQVLLGLTARGGTLIKRVNSVFREIFGIILLPFIIFDISTLFSKRSFKEIITRTQVVSLSGAYALIGGFFWIIIFAIGYGFSPLVKGLDLLPEVKVQTVENRISPWTYKNKLKSTALGLSYESDENFTTLPTFSITMTKKIKKIRPGIVIVDTNTGKGISIIKTKTFTISELYKDFVGLNLLSQVYQPQIYALVKDVSLNNKNFKKSKADTIILTEETKGIISSIYGLNLKTLPDFILSQGAMVNGHRDFREKFSSVFKDKIEKINFFNMRQEQGIRTVFSGEHNVGKDGYYSLVPIGHTSPKIPVYELSQNLASPMFEKTLSHLTFNVENSKEDFISKFMTGFIANPKRVDFEANQLVYERYFDLSKFFIENSSMEGLKLVEENARKLLSLIESNKVNHKKLYQNISELIQAIGKNDKEFFQIEEIKSI